MSKKHVLVVDDEAIILHTIKDELIDEGYIVDTAKNGEEGLEKIKARYYDLVITDLIMSPKDGYDIINLVTNFNYETKIIVMTGYVNDFFSKESFNHGISILMKPYSREELVEKVRDCLMDS